MPTAIIASQIQIGGTQMNASNTLSGNAQESYRPTNDVPAPESGTLTTRTDADTGVVTITGTTITTSDKVMGFWEESGVRKTRTNMTVTDVTGDAVTIDLGDGDDLPAQDSAIDLAVQIDMAAAFDGDDLVAIAATSTRDAAIAFYDSGDVLLLKCELYAGSAWFWQADSSTAVPITGNAVARMCIGNRDTAGPAIVDVGLLQNV